MLEMHRKVIAVRVGEVRFHSLKCLTRLVVDEGDVQYQSKHLIQPLGFTCLVQKDGRAHPFYYTWVMFKRLSFRRAVAQLEVLIRLYICTADGEISDKFSCFRRTRKYERSHMRDEAVAVRANTLNFIKPCVNAHFVM